MYTDTISNDADEPRDIYTPREMRSRFRYSGTFDGFTREEIRTITEVKRFAECYEGDREFRAAVEAGGRFTGEQRQMLKDIGIRFEPEAMALFWEYPTITNWVLTSVAECKHFRDLPDAIHSIVAPYPEMRTWLRWRFRRHRMTAIQKTKASHLGTLSPEFTAWRARRVAAVRNELGAYGWDLDHPCHAVEMAVGCSVGCGFCAFDAQRLQTVFDASRLENRELFAGVATGMSAVLGWPAAHGMLYWSTEPNDNPHYVRLLGLWEEITGAKLCTATARSGDDWVRELIDYYSSGEPAPWPRISVLTRSIMRRLHRNFTPMEFRDVTMLMQQKDAEEIRGKVPGGRERMLKRLVDADDLRDVDIDNLPVGFEPPQGSIACVSGLLVNLVNRTLKLISPCYTTMEYRYGYRVYDETTFGGSRDFTVALKRVIDRSLAVRPYPEMPVRWRDDLKVVPQPDGFTLLSPTSRRDFRQGELHRRAAELLGRGNLTYERAVEALSKTPGVGPMTAGIMLNSLFDRGYLCELAVTRDYRARREAADASLREPAALAA